MRFRNRADAGRALASALSSYKSQNPIVLALPRGGVPVAAEVAEQLAAPLDIILVRKIGAPIQPELALGAVVDGGRPIIVRNPDVIRLTGTTESQFQAICDEELAEIERRRRLFLGSRQPLNPEGRVAIVIDDGIATGATMRAALLVTRMRNPKKLVLAVPVAAPSTLEELRPEVDDIVCLASTEHFEAVGYFYADFRQLTDEDVSEILARVSAGQTAET
ncbi:MAG TPA: phosphoribosyltransferase [Micropepsaceae bacterium]|jgi:predicted phosphoribosyltransferase|nr:phosphoribosyltransferase [Micropepsaceae bacterium]